MRKRKRIPILTIDVFSNIFRSALEEVGTCSVISGPLTKAQAVGYLEMRIWDRINNFQTSALKGGKGK